MIPSDVAIARGREAFKFFHNAALASYPQNYPYSFTGLIEHLNQIRPYLLEGYGRLLLQNGVRDDALETFMQKIVEKGQGRLPEKLSELYKVIDAKSWGWLETVKFVTVETTKDAVEGAAKVGDAALGGLTGVLKYFPVILAAGVMVYAFARGRAGI